MQVCVVRLSRTFEEHGKTNRVEHCRDGSSRVESSRVESMLGGSGAFSTDPTPQPKAQQENKRDQKRHQKRHQKHMENKTHGKRTH